jgi:hypothetical protein
MQLRNGDLLLHRTYQAIEFFYAAALRRDGGFDGAARLLHFARKLSKNAMRIGLKFCTTALKPLFFACGHADELPNGFWASFGGEMPKHLNTRLH